MPHQRSDVEGVELLSFLGAVLIHFLHVARFYTGTSAHAIEARNLHGAQGFYASFSAKLSVLKQDFDDRAARARTVPAVFESISDLLRALQHCLNRATVKPSPFESGTSAVAEHFPRLHTFRQRADEAAAQGRSLTVSLEEHTEWRTFFVLGKISASHTERRRLFGAIDACVKLLPRRPRPATNQKTTRDSQPTAIPHTEARRWSGIAFAELARRLTCKCEPQVNGVRLALDRHSASENDSCRFHILLERPLTPEWQNCTIDVMQDSGTSNAVVTTSATSQTSALRDVTSICGLCHEQLTSELLLKLSTTQGNLRYVADLHGSALRTAVSHNPTFLQLSALISGRGAALQIDEINPKERMALAVILANSFLHLYENGWWPDSWTTESVYLSLDETEGLLDCRVPFLATSCHVQQGPLLLGENNVRLHPHPHIFKLGLTLMELLEGYSMESAVDQDEFLQAQGVPHLRYRSAVNACIEAQTFPRGIAFDQVEFRQRFWEKIVREVEEEFKIAFAQKDLRSLNQRPRDSTAILKSKAARRVREGIAREETTSLESQRSIPNAANLVPDVFIQPYPDLQFQTLDEVTLHDDTNQYEPAEKEDIVSADAWMKMLKTLVHPVIRADRMNGWAMAHLDKESTEPIKIAILDTGVALPPALAGIDIKIEECRSWLETDDPDGVLLEEGSDCDLDGHGTHGAGLLLECAPRAKVYAGRVFRNRSEKQTDVTSSAVHQRIARAISYATNKWKVDIISMSFGTSRSHPTVDNAIYDASKKKVLLFASASNCGGNADITYPASSPLVLAVSATNGLGNKYNRNPTARARQYNFATLGVAVESWWPESRKQGPRLRKSGTSTATPVAAGIAANILEILRRHSGSVMKSEADRTRVWEDIKTAAGIEKVFACMSRGREEYDYVEPWTLIDQRWPQTSSPEGIIYSILTALQRP